MAYFYVGTPITFDLSSKTRLSISEINTYKVAELVSSCSLLSLPKIPYTGDEDGMVLDTECFSKTLHWPGEEDHMVRSILKSQVSRYWNILQ